MRPLSESAARVAGQNFKRKYVALGRIVKHWPEIVGENLSTKAQPVKLNYRKHKKSKAPTVSLDIAVSSANATVLHYQKDLILERINQIFGDQWIHAIRFVQTPMNANSGFGRAKFSKKAQPPLTEGEKKSLSEWLDTVDDDEIRARLQRLGEGMFAAYKD